MSHSEYITPDGERLPSVTEVLRIVNQPFIMNWYKSMVMKKGKRGWLECEARFDEGCQFGQDAHQALEWGDMLHPVVKLVNEQFTPQVQEMVCQEVKLVSNKYRYHGTADFICRLEGDPGLFVGDWKTSNSDSVWYVVQMAAYANAWNESHKDQKIDQAVCVHYDKKLKTPKLKVTRFYGLEKYFKAFLACKDVMDYDRQTGLWRKTDATTCLTIPKVGILGHSTTPKE